MASESERLAIAEHDIRSIDASLKRIEELLQRVENNQVDIATNTTVTYRVGKIIVAVITAVIGFTHWEEILRMFKHH